MLPQQEECLGEAAAGLGSGMLGPRDGELPPDRAPLTRTADLGSLAPLALLGLRFILTYVIIIAVLPSR